MTVIELSQYQLEETHLSTWMVFPPIQSQTNPEGNTCQSETIDWLQPFRNVSLPLFPPSSSPPCGWATPHYKCKILLYKTLFK